MTKDGVGQSQVGGGNQREGDLGQEVEAGCRIIPAVAASSQGMPSYAWLGPGLVSGPVVFRIQRCET